MAPVLRCGDVVEGKEGRWEVERKIGEGQFSEVFQVFDRATQEHVSRPPLPLFLGISTLEAYGIRAGSSTARKCLGARGRCVFMGGCK